MEVPRQQFLYSAADILNALKATVYVKERIVKAHALVEMSLKKKRNLEKTLNELVSKKQKISYNIIYYFGRF